MQRGDAKVAARSRTEKQEAGKGRLWWLTTTQGAEEGRRDGGLPLEADRKKQEADEGRLRWLTREQRRDGTVVDN